MEELNQQHHILVNWIPKEKADNGGNSDGVKQAVITFIPYCKVGLGMEYPKVIELLLLDIHLP